MSNSIEEVPILPAMLAWSSLSSYIPEDAWGPAKFIRNEFISSGDSLIEFFTPVARACTLPPSTFTFADEQVAKVGALAGMDNPDTIKFVLILLLVYPFAAIFALLPSGYIKHFVSATSGILLAQWMFGLAWFNSFFTSLVTYLLLFIAQQVPSVGAMRHSVIMAWMMGFMTIAHLWRLHSDYLGWNMDYTGSQMILTIKLTSLAFNLYDGAKASKYQLRIDEISNRPKTGAGSVTPDVARAESNEKRKLQGWLERSTPVLPDLLSFLGYVYLPTSFFSGPAFEYAYYEASVSGKCFETGKDKKINLDWSGRLKATVTKLAFGLLFLVLTVVAMTYKISPSTMYSPSVVIGTSFFYRAGWNWLVLFFARCKYYFAWLVAEGSTNLAGFGYAPNAKGNWESVKNMDVIGFETATDVTKASKAWNMGTANWLGQYCGLRLPKNIKDNAVYTLSAVWHGFYPGYYLTFLSMPLFQDLERAIRAKVTPLLFPAGPESKPGAWTAYNIASMIGTSLALNYLVCPFQALSWNDSITVWASLYFIGHILAIVTLILLNNFVPNIKVASGGGADGTAAGGAAGPSSKSNGRRNSTK